jgi:pre-mRNA-splicing factor RBM22/SLT11
MQKGQGKFEDKLKDRYNGVNDPLAEKIADKIKTFKVPEAPEDPNITTLFIGGI